MVDDVLAPGPISGRSSVQNWGGRRKFDLHHRLCQRAQPQAAKFLGRAMAK
jgi:hypothetical protein